MPQRKLRPISGGDSGAVTLDKDDLDEVGAVNENGEVEERSLIYERLGPGEFKLIVLDGSGEPVSGSD